MSTRQHEPPHKDEIEISVFGPGYGEAILLHIGNGKWILVDSCMEPSGELPASLRYLYGLGVDPKEAVELVVATHWHDDHVRGLSDLLAACENAKLALSSALSTDQFHQLAAAYSTNAIAQRSGVSEFERACKILNSRKSSTTRFNSPTFALSDRPLFSDLVQLGSETMPVKVTALSPSDASVLQAQLSFTEQLEEAQARKRIAPPSPNHASVVLWVEIGDQNILLGADLEATSDPITGWTAILDNSTAIRDRAVIFKIPHHGSEKAHHDRVWSEILADAPIAPLSPYSRGRRKLPSAFDMKRIAGLTPNAYLTAPVRQRRTKWRNKTVRDLVRDMAVDMWNVHSGWGHVRIRRHVEGAENKWQVELFGDACEVVFP